MSVGGVILTGGESRRFGRDKATVLVHGEPLARHVASVVQAVCDPVIESGNRTTGLRCVREDPPGSGPLAAALAGIFALGDWSHVMVVACDFPLLTETVVRAIAEHESHGSVVPVVAGRPQLACARWSRRTLEHAVDAHSRGERALRVILDAPDCCRLSADAWAHELTDVDTPGDMERLGLS